MLAQKKQNMDEQPNEVEKSVVPRVTRKKAKPAVKKAAKITEDDKKKTTRAKRTSKPKKDVEDTVPVRRSSRIRKVAT